MTRWKEGTLETGKFISMLGSTSLSLGICLSQLGLCIISFCATVTKISGRSDPREERLVLAHNLSPLCWGRRDRETPLMMVEVCGRSSSHFSKSISRDIKSEPG